MGELYAVDVLEWSEQQAQLLRQLAEGHLTNERPDWVNIIEEIESVGRSEVRSVSSLLTLAFLHDLKCEAWPLSREVPHWQAEARLFRRQAKRTYTASMRTRIDVAELYQDALTGLPTDMDGQAAGPVRQTTDLTIETLLEGDPTIA